MAQINLRKSQKISKNLKKSQNAHDQLHSPTKCNRDEGPRLISENLKKSQKISEGRNQCTSRRAACAQSSANRAQFGALRAPHRAPIGHNSARFARPIERQPYTIRRASRARSSANRAQFGALRAPNGAPIVHNSARFARQIERQQVTMRRASRAQWSADCAQFGALRAPDRAPTGHNSARFARNRERDARPMDRNTCDYVHDVNVTYDGVDSCSKLFR
jgi:hypothetical protein